ncbi:hypothetical protein F5Y03DRAFT_225317 [Xylaria venustula]|nr:hypothetical protein F5Y03DRAFT_225317 [Xylaria venustula]
MPKRKFPWTRRRSRKKVDIKESNAQSNSLFFSHLPQEIRDEVYRQVFSNTRLTFAASVRPKENSLALLRTCRRIRFEIGNTWLRYVLFNFGNPMDMVSKLGFLPIDIISEIRYIRVYDHYPIISWRSFYYNSLDLYPISGLQLDRLTVISGGRSDRSYYWINHLIEFGDGWKELHYIHYTLHMLAFESSWSSEIHREPQPSHWQQVLEDRDTKLTKPLITIYQSTKPGVFGSATDPDTRVILAQAIRPDQTADNYHRYRDHKLRDDYRNKEVLIIAKRGIGVDYKQKIGVDRDSLRKKLEHYILSYYIELPTADVYTHPYEYNEEFHSSHNF